MAYANTIERKNEAELNEERATGKTEDEKIALPAKSEPNMGEYMIFGGIALFLDAAGALSDISVILAIPIRIVTLIPTLVFLLWRLLKGGKRVYPAGLAIMGVSEAILSILPAYTCFVAYAWFKESKLGKSTIGKIDKLAKIKT